MQDNCVLHAAEGLPTILEDEVTVGHLATMEGCVIERGALIGMGAVVLQPGRHGVGGRGRERGRRGRAVSPEVLAAGIPARVKRELSGKAEQWGCTAAREYQRLAPRYLAEARAVRLTSGGSG